MNLASLYDFVAHHPNAKFVRVPYDEYKALLNEIPESFCQRFYGWPFIIIEGVIIFAAPDGAYQFYSEKE